jgi:tagatose 1,6-diphosphate aldolase
MPESSLSVGKVRGLESTSNPAGIFTILAFDHRQSFVKMLNPQAPERVTYEDVVEAKAQVVRALAAYTSAVLLDPVYGAGQAIASGALPGQAGLLVAIEETGYEGESTARLSSLLPGWSVEKAKRMGADAVKFLVYYHPEAGEVAEQQEELVAEVIQACRRVDLACFLEPVSYSLDPSCGKDSPGFAAVRPELITAIARRLGALGPDVLKLEFPVDAGYDLGEKNWRQACEAVSAASPCPWTVLSGGVDYATFALQVKAACREGASGFIAGRAVWQEGIPLPSGERERWLRGEGSRRLAELSEIAERYARPWRDYYPGLEQPVQGGWYLEYGE